MSSITDLLEKRLNQMQKEKAEETKLLIEKLKLELKDANSLAEQRLKIIQSLEHESNAKILENFNLFRKRVLQILGVKQIGVSDEEILSEISEYKMSTKFWRQKYHNLCSDIESMTECLDNTIGDPIDRQQVAHQTDANILLLKMRALVEKNDEMKTKCTKLWNELKEKESYCQRLIELRNKLDFEIDSLKEEISKINRSFDSLKDKSFWQNKVIEIFEQLVWQKNKTSKAIVRNTSFENELKKYKHQIKDSFQSHCKVMPDFNCEAMIGTNRSLSVKNTNEDNDSKADSGNFLENGRLKKTPKDNTSELFRRIDFCDDSCDRSYSTPNSKKMHYSLRSASKDGSNSSDSSFKRKNRSLEESSSNENQSRKQPQRKAKSNLFSNTIQ